MNNLYSNNWVKLTDRYYWDSLKELLHDEYTGVTRSIQDCMRLAYSPKPVTSTEEPPME